MNPPAPSVTSGSQATSARVIDGRLAERRRRERPGRYRDEIGEAAERSGSRIRTIRHYEEVGLILPSARSGGGFRLYTEPDLARLRVVKDMKPLGFTLEEMREVLNVIDAPARRAGSTRA